MSTAARRRSMHQRWPFLKKEAEGRAWMQANREPLRRAAYRIRLDTLLALHWLRYLLIRYTA